MPPELVEGLLEAYDELAAAADELDGRRRELGRRIRAAFEAGASRRAVAAELELAPSTVAELADLADDGG